MVALTQTLQLVAIISPILLAAILLATVILPAVLLTTLTF
jgi:hypothetical protein